MPAPWPLRFGVFYSPFHPVGQNPTLALEYDVALDAMDETTPATNGGGS
jgi:hypothetical protein